MADFTSGFWSWFIGISTIVSIVAVIILVVKLTTRPRGPNDAPVETMGHVWDETLEEYNNPMPRWWLNLFYITLAWGVIYLALYPGLGAFKGLLGWSQVDQYEQEVAAAEAEYGPLFAQYQQIAVADLAANKDAIKMGERLFSTYCTTCHGSDARGARGFPNLRDGDWLYGGEPDQIIATITNGRSGVMPAWGEILGAEKVSTVASYVQQLAGRTADPAAAAAGKAVFDVNCVACHGADGGGNQLLGAPSLKDDVWLYGGSPTRIVESITAGRNGVMPPHGEFLGPAKIHLLSAYVYQFRNR
jgi:cytochrome c oxidase cbb3-type subunit III